MNDGWDALTELPDGSLRSPAGVTFHRTPDRVRRANGDALIEAGAPVVTTMYTDGLEWHEDEAATAAWAQILPALATGARPNSKDLQWVGHVWASDAGETLLRFDGEHCRTTNSRQSRTL